MLSAVGRIENVVGLALFFGVLALEAYAIVDAALRPGEAYSAAGKLTKTGWVLILGLALLVTVALRAPMGILGLIGVTATGVYLADVRPALAQLTRRR